MTVQKKAILVVILVAILFYGIVTGTMDGPLVIYSTVLVSFMILPILIDFNNTVLQSLSFALALIVCMAVTVVALDYVDVASTRQILAVCLLLMSGGMFYYGWPAFGPMLGFKPKEIKKEDK